MVVPIVYGSLGRPSAVTVKAEVLTSENVDRFAEAARALLQGRKSPGPVLSEGWDIQRDPLDDLLGRKRIHVIEQVVGSGPWKEIQLTESGSTDEVGLVVNVSQHRNSRSVTMGMDIGRARRPASLDDWILTNDFAMRLEGLAVRGLKEYVGLLPEHRVDLVCHVFFKSLGLMLDEEEFEDDSLPPRLRELFETMKQVKPSRERMYEQAVEIFGEEEAKKIMNREPRQGTSRDVYVQSHIRDLGPGETCSFDYRVEKESLGFTEEVAIYFFSSSHHFPWPLPTSVRPMWDWLLSDRSEPDENMRQKYYEMTERTYGHLKLRS